MSKVSCLFYRKLDKCFAEHVIKIHDMIIKMNEINEIFKFVIHKGKSFMMLLVLNIEIGSKVSNILRYIHVQLHLCHNAKILNAALG